MARSHTVLGIVCALLAGCFTSDRSKSSAWLERLRPFQGAAGRDVVVMDVALLERPIGDHYINQDFWGDADEQVVATERRALIEDNGFRVGLVGGILPEGLQELLTSGRSCVDPRRIQKHAGTATQLALGPTLAQCIYHQGDDAKQTTITLEGADCQLDVTPTLLQDGAIRLQFVPQVQHGQAALLPKPDADRSGWEMFRQRPTERYSYLTWELVVHPGEYVVIGARYDRPGTLGHRAFIHPEAPPAQRLLVIRAGRLQPETFAGAEDDGPVRHAPSLACQAAYVTARGRSN